MKCFFESKTNTTQTNLTNKYSKMSSTKQQSKNKPFCKVCYDAGKSIAEYSTHYVRDQRGGNVVCPTLLKQQCKYCKETGHTPSHCPALEGKYNKSKQPPKKESSQIRAARLCESPPPREEIKNKNYFNSLADIMENEEAKAVEAKAVEAKAVEAKAVEAKAVEAKAVEAKAVEVKVFSENFPIVGQKQAGKIIRPEPMKLNAWASIVAQTSQTKQAEAKHKAQQDKEQQDKAQQDKEQQDKEQQQAEPVNYMASISTSWADM